MAAWSGGPGTLLEEVKVDLRSADEGSDEVCPMSRPRPAGALTPGGLRMSSAALYSGGLLCQV